jgi:hypothetical protein
MGEVLNWFLKKECLNISGRILAVYKIQRHTGYTTYVPIVFKNKSSSGNGFARLL